MENKFYTREECKQMLIDLGINKTENGKYLISAGISGWLRNTKYDLLKKSILFHTQHLNENSTLSERNYCITHNIFEKQYCPVCNNEVRFRSYSRGYYKHCSAYCNNHCEIRAEKIKKSCKASYDVTQKQRKITCLKKYGVEFPFQSKEIQIKVRENNWYHGGFAKWHKKHHEIATHLYFDSNDEKQFIDLLLQFYPATSINNSFGIKYIFNNKETIYFPDFILTYPSNKKVIIEIKATHHYFFNDLKSGRLFAKWDYTNKYIEEHKDEYDSYVFILNGEIVDQNYIKENYLVRRK